MPASGRQARRSLVIANVLKPWQIKRLEKAAAQGRRNISVKELCGDLQLQRADVLQWLKDHQQSTDQPTRCMAVHAPHLTDSCHRSHSSSSLFSCVTYFCSRASLAASHSHSEAHADYRAVDRSSLEAGSRNNNPYTWGDGQEHVSSVRSTSQPEETHKQRLRLPKELPENSSMVPQCHGYAVLHG